MNATTTPNFKSTTEIRQANADCGHYWFSPDTLRFFNSRIGLTVFGGRYFWTSEQYDWNSPRRYTIREATADGMISTVGEFQAYATSQDAIRAIRRLLAEV